MASLVNHSVTNLINGVSQQATAVRLDNQLEKQVNCFSDVTKGLTIRNGLELQHAIPADISNRIKIEFDLDGTKQLVAMDITDATQLLHVPLSADIDQLSASITSSYYFDGVSTEDIKIIEDKDRVYILNTKKIVGTTKLKSTFFDIKVTNNRTSTTDTNWSTGTYDITVTSVADIGSGAVVAESPFTYTVSSTDTIFDIADAINANSITNETGTCSVSGNKGAYRLYFEEIPQGFAPPQVVVLEQTAITYTYNVTIKEPASGFFFNDTASHTFVESIHVGSTSTYTYFWNGSLIVSTTNKPFTSGGYTYHVGNLKTYQLLYQGTMADVYLSRYEIRREKLEATTDNYSVSVVAPSTSVVSGQNDEFADEAMVWVTGVASNQSYSLTMKYTNQDGSGLTTLGPYSVNVGTTTSNIKLNYVAQQLASQIPAPFSTTVYNNAIHIRSTTQYDKIITSIEVDNNFDTTSLNGVIKATINNESGVLDTSNLPSLFYDRFKIRVGNETTTGANYYLSYNEALKGWQETGLDETRVLDAYTMPYIIDKNNIRRNNVITLEPFSWVESNAGDYESNPDPSFINRTINDLFFYGSRLGMATDDTLVMSGIDKPNVFYRTTASKVVTEDRVDIKLDTSKIGYDSINSVVTYDGKLLVNTGSTQSVLIVNTNFDLTTARLSEVSSYTLGSLPPLPVNNGLYFSVNSNNFTNIYNYTVAGNNTYDATNITKHIPTYIRGIVTKMVYGNNMTAVTVDYNKKYLYIQNRFTQGSEVLQNAWHRWELPYDVEYMYFDDNILYVLMTATDSLNVVNTFVCKFDVTPQVVTADDNGTYIGWIPYLDCYTKDKSLIENFPEFIGINDKYGQRYADVTSAYDSTISTQSTLGATDGPYYALSSPIYYWKVEGNLNTVVFNDGPPVLFGNNALTYFDHSDGFRYYRGELMDEDLGLYEVSRAAITADVIISDDILYGVPFTATVELSEIIPRQQTQEGPIVMNYAKLMLRRMRLYLNSSGLFYVNVDFKDRQDFNLVYTGQPLGSSLLGRAGVSDVNFSFPINGKSDKVKITISTDSSTPFNLLSAEWQGQLTMNGRNI